MLGFVLRDLEFVAFENVVDGGCKVVCVECAAETHVFKLVADVEAESITEFVHDMIGG